MVVRVEIKGVFVPQRVEVVQNSIWLSAALSVFQVMVAVEVVMSLDVILEMTGGLVATGAVTVKF